MKAKDLLTLKFSNGKCKGDGSAPSQQHCWCPLSGHLLGVRVAKATGAEQQHSVGEGNVQRGIKMHKT